MNNYNRLANDISEGLGNELEKNNEKKIIPLGRNTIANDNINSINYLGENINNNNFGNFGQKLNGKPNNLNIGFIINDINNNNYSVDSSLKKPLQENKENISSNKNNITQLLNNSNTNYSNNPTINDFNSNSNNNIFPANQDNNNSNININTSSFQQNNNLNQNINQAFDQPKKLFNFQNNNQTSNNDIEKNNINNINPFNQQIKDNSISSIGEINDNNVNQNGKEVEKESNDKPAQNIFASILDENNNKTNNNLFNTNSNKKEKNNLNIFPGNIISQIDDNRVFNSNNEIFSNNPSFNNDINNMNNAPSNKLLPEINMNKDNKTEKNSFSFENNNNNNQIPINSNSKNLILSSPFTQIITNNNNQFLNANNPNINSGSSSSSNNLNINMNNNMYNTPAQNKNSLNIMDSKYLAGLAYNCKTILEEANESESDIKNQKERDINIEYYLKKPFILSPIPTTNKIKIITEDESDENIISLTFPPNFNISSFLYKCSHCNHNNKLYISGGILNPGKSQTSSNKFFMIDLSKFNINNNINSCLIELPSMIYSRSNHSMIRYNKEIFAVGGEDSNTVEKYDIEKNIWIEIGPMIKKRSNTMLAIHNGYLYAFFGKGENGKYPESIERINLEKNNSFWEMILYSNPSNINTKLYGCGMYQIDDLIYFLGGKCNEKAIDDIFFFNFIDRNIGLTDSKLSFKESFRENTLFNLGKKIVQISEGKFFGVYLQIYVK